MIGRMIRAFGADDVATLVPAKFRKLRFLMIANILTGVLFGAGPARRAWKADPAMSLKGLAAPVSSRRWAARDILLPV
jgi:hypothetical protein